MVEVSKGPDHMAHRVPFLWPVYKDTFNHGLLKHVLYPMSPPPPSQVSMKIITTAYVTSSYSKSPPPSNYLSMWALYPGNLIVIPWLGCIRMPVTIPPLPLITYLMLLYICVSYPDPACTFPWRDASYWEPSKWQPYQTQDKGGECGYLPTRLSSCTALDGGINISVGYCF